MFPALENRQEYGSEFQQMPIFAHILPGPARPGQGLDGSRVIR